MRLLLDTHALLWWLGGDLRLSRVARQAIDPDDATVFVSAVSIFEIATKHRLGKLPLQPGIAADLVGTVQAHGFDHLPLDDAKVYRLFSEGRTEAVFQFESGGMQRMLRDAKPSRLEDLIALNAMFRPGPMENIPSFCARKNGKEEVAYPHALLGQVLEETYGIFVYQEQVMQAAQVLGGYSLGGTHAAYVSYIDTKEKRLNFQKAIVINPAVDLYNSVNRLDNMVSKHLSSDPVAVDNFINHIFDQIIALYTVKDKVDFTDNAFMYRAYTVLEPPEQELELLIGLVFRMTSADMSFTSDVMTNSGYLVPKNAQLTSTTSLTDVMLEAMRLSFVNYMDGVYVPFIQRREPGVTREQLIARASLRPIEQYLRTDPKVVMLGTQDDVILSRDEVNWLEDVFGERARIFPTGGHCGSMDQREFIRTMLELIWAPEARS